MYTCTTLGLSHSRPLLELSTRKKSAAQKESVRDYLEEERMERATDHDNNNPKRARRDTIESAVKLGLDDRYMISVESPLRESPHECGALRRLEQKADGTNQQEASSKLESK